MSRAPLLLAAAALGLLLFVPGALGLETSLRAIRVTGEANGASVATAFPSIDGTGVVVAVLDTGVSNTHPSLRGAHLTGVDVSKPCNAGGYLTGTNPDDVSCYVESDPVDTYGHGTHVAGILLGRGSAGGPRGVAPDALLVDVKIAVDLTPSVPGLKRGLLWVLAYNERHPPGDPARIDVVSVSAGSMFPGNVTDPDALVAQRLVRSGVVVVAAAGNCGDSGAVGCPQTGGNTTSSPAIAAGVLGVGATDDRGTPARGDDVVAAYSSRGPAGGSPKPDLVAPGTDISSAFEHPLLPPNSDAYVNNTGTSMATPHVAGVVALMLEADPRLKPADVVSILHATSWRMGSDAPSPDWGYGMLDAHEAVRAVKLLSNAPPVAVARLASASALAGVNLTFDGLGSHDADGRVVSWSWSFGDGAVASGANVTHAYAAPGAYTVTLTVADELGASSTTTLPVAVAAVRREARFDVAPALEGTTATTFRFEANGTGVGLLTYSWDLGDGTRVVGASVEHRYETPGNRTVRLTLLDETGANVTFERVVVVRARPLLADVTVSGSAAPVAGARVVLDASASSLPASLVEAVWEFGDGFEMRCSADGCLGKATDPLRVPHTYREPGAYRVRVTLRDASGGVSTAEREVRVLPTAPVATIVAAAEARQDEPFAMQATLAPAGLAARAYRWDFGDGATATGRSVSHIFPSLGLYEVKVRVEDEHGRFANASMVLRVVEAPVTETPPEAETAPDDAGQAAPGRAAPTAPLLLALMEPLDASDVTAGEVLLRWEYDDARAPVTTLVFLDGEAVASTEHAHVRLFVPPGVHTLRVVSSDATGRHAEAGATIRALAPWDVPQETVNLTPLKGASAGDAAVPAPHALGLLALAGAALALRRRS